MQEARATLAAQGQAERLAITDLTTTSVGAEHLARYLFAAHWAAGQNVADLCCGTGYGTNLMLSSGAKRALGIDVDRAAIEQARAKFERCQFDVADLTHRYDLREFPVRVSFEALEHLSDPHGLVRNLAAALPPAGAAIVSTPNGEAGHSGNPFHVHEYTREELRTLLQAHFRDVRLFFQWHVQDPLDTEWTVSTILKALVPVRVKHAFKRRRVTLERDPSSADIPPGLPAKYRPLPLGYLSALPPGLRYERPKYWIAVCHGALT